MSETFSKPRFSNWSPLDEQGLPPYLDIPITQCTSLKNLSMLKINFTKQEA